mmetsp:Transcript_20001/g.25881  ORF Transcript_20001/g.25881 Transcript_20001/m.25881 type:complete len:364 (+) Transcript_20001:87-1178(+)
MDEIWIYHERQFSLLCGQHCLNNLLQGPYFTAPDLAAVGQELDAEERRMMLEAGTDTTDALKFLAEDSGNVDETGNFSIQVLNTALERGHSLTLINTDSSSIRNSIREYTQETGYICNRSEHWFAIRKIGNNWWNLNSTMERPEHISDFYLDAFLGQLRAEGYQVFVCRPQQPSGTFPPLISDQSVGEPTNWHREPYLLSLPKGSGRDDVEKDVWASAGQGYSLGGGVAGPSSSEQNSAPTGELSEEEQLAAAIAMSLETQMAQPSAVIPEEPPVGDSDAARIQVRLPSGKKFVRRFRSTDHVSGLFAYIRKELIDQSVTTLQGDFEVVAPQGKILKNAQPSEQITLESEGLSPSASVFVRLR